MLVNNTQCDFQIDSMVKQHINLPPNPISRLPDFAEGRWLETIDPLRIAG